MRAAKSALNKGVVALSIAARPLSIPCCAQKMSVNGMALLSSPMQRQARHCLIGHATGRRSPRYQQHRP